MKEKTDQNSELDKSKERQLPEERPEIYGINKAEHGSTVSRKDFLKTAGAIGAGVVATASCASSYNSTTRKKRTMEVVQLEKVSKTYTIPCDSPLPANAVCLCNCVESSRTHEGFEMVCTCNTITMTAGTALNEYWTCSCDTVMTCTCNKVCTCDTVCSCNNHSRSYTTYRSYWYPS